MSIQSLQAAQGYGVARQSRPDTDPSNDPPLAKAASDFRTSLAKAEMTATEAMSGGADPHALVEALAIRNWLSKPPSPCVTAWSRPIRKF